MASRQTRVLGGNGTATQSFTLDPGLLQYVQSVLVEIDNGAGPAIRPTLTVATNNGQALAKQQQGRSIPAGDTGSATWALRLADEREQAVEAVLSGDPNLWTFPTAGPTVTIGRFTLGAWIERDALGVAQNIANDPFLGNAPTGLRHNRSNWHNGITVDLVSNPSRLIITNAGLYLFITTVAWLPGNFPLDGLYTAALSTGSAEDTGSSTARIIANRPNRVTSVGFGRRAVGDAITQQVSQDTGGPIAAPQGSLMVYRLGPRP